MRLYLIRHGQTVANVNKLYAGQTDVALTEEGREQAKALRPLLSQISFDRVYSSDLSRAIITQQLALPGVIGQPRADLRERDMGLLVGQRFADLWQRHPEGVPYDEYNCEPRPVMDVRIGGFLRELEAEPAENVAAFVHSGVMFSMLRQNPGPGLDMSAPCGNCCIAVWEYQGKQHWEPLAWDYKGSPL